MARTIVSQKHRVLKQSEKDRIQSAIETLCVADASQCEHALNTCEVISHCMSAKGLRNIGSAVAYLALRTNASGITLGSSIFLRPELFDCDGNIPIDILAHEVAHVVQYHRDGFLRFILRYILEYTLGRLRGLGDFDSYLAISYEVEARAVSHLLRCERHTPAF